MHPDQPPFPVPVRDDRDPHVYVSVGHQQMMTDAMRPLGLSLWQLTALRPMYEAGGRLFVDVTLGLAAPSSRAALLEALGRSDPLIRDALQTVLDRGDFVPTLPDDGPGEPLVGLAPARIETDPSVVAELVARSEASIANLAREIATTTGEALLDLIAADLQELKRLLADPQSLQVITAAMQAAWWLDEHLLEWLGETNAADTLSLSVPGNVTSEMGLALLDVADAIRPHPEVVAFLRRAGENFMDGLDALEGGRAAREAIVAYLDRYGMRCAGEIDITRPRWSERPAMLLPLILGNVDRFAPGERERRFERGRRAAADKAHEVLERLRSQPDGAAKAEETERMIDRLRTFAGYREFPKYVIVRRYFLYKQALMAEAARLVQAGALGEADDISFLTFPELRDVVRAGQVDHGLLRRRRDEYRMNQALVPPRVLTSDGVAVTGSYRHRDVPAGALVGLAVSAGRVEGRARVVRDIGEAVLLPGDILVTAHTDPSWSPLFVAVSGLVTEAGGMMTHGAVIAREYGLPAVVGVAHATRLIRDGQRIRVDGVRGYVELLPEPETVSTRP